MRTLLLIAEGLFLAVSVASLFLFSPEFAIWFLLMAIYLQMWSNSTRK